MGLRYVVVRIFKDRKLGKRMQKRDKRGRFKKESPIIKFLWLFLGKD
jgi:hypothetical protein